MFGVGFPELIVIFVVILIVYGPGKLPQIGSALGQGISEFKRAAAGLEESLFLEASPRPRPPVIPTGDPKRETPPAEPEGIAITSRDPGQNRSL